MGETFYTTFFALFLYNTFEFSLTQDFFCYEFYLAGKKGNYTGKKKY